MVVANKEINETKNTPQTLAILITNVVVQCGVHHPMEHITGFTRSHWMPPSGKCLHRISAEAAMVDEFGRKHKTINNQKLFLAS